MSSQIILDANERAKVKISIPTYLNKIYYTARARIYWARASTKRWSYAGIHGALVFLLNTSSNTLHFQMVDLDGDRGVIWDYELQDGLVLDQEKSVTFFLSFEGDVGGEKRTIGFVFMDDSEAKTFHNHVKTNKDTKSSKLNRPSLKKSISKGGGNINKSMISHPKEGAFVHVAHMGYNADSGFTSTGVDPSWTALLESLHGYLGKEVVADDMDFIKDFIRNYSERQQNRSLAAPRRKLPPPPPKRIKLTPPSSLPAARTQPSPAAPHRPVSPVVEDEQLPPTPPPRRPTPPSAARTQPPLVVPHGSIGPVVEDEQLPPTPPPRRPTPTPVRTQPRPVAPHRPISLVVEDEQLSPIPPPRRPTTPTPVRTQPRPVAPHRPISPVVEDEQLPPTPPPRRPTPPTTAHGAPRTPERPLPPQPGDLTLPREMEPKQTTTGIPYSRPHYLKSPPLPLVLSHSNSRIRSNSPSITPSNSASASSAGTVIRQQESHRNQSLGLPSPTPEAVPEDEVEPDITQTVQLPSQPSWILASRIPRASKKPVDEFMTYMADRRRQTNDSDESSTNSSPRSLSVSSPPPGAVLFPPTPVFKDEFPKGIMQKVKLPPLDSSTSRGFVNRN